MNVDLEIFSRPQAKGKLALDNICFSKQIFYRKRSLGAPVTCMETLIIPGIKKTESN